MNLRASIEDVFQGRAFARPLFYSHPGGLRFELSEGGSNVTIFLDAMRKARQICDEVFANAASLTVILSIYGFDSRYRYRDVVRALRGAGVAIPSEREIWSETDPGDDLSRIFLAFKADRKLLDNFLWCAFAGELGIEPGPGCSVYLADFKERLLVLPYDYRGMDVVGPAHDRLAKLYRQFHAYLLEYDLDVMRATFEPG
ncbi:DUF3885 domain-containing protein [Massilia sp. SR12]